MKRLNVDEKYGILIAGQKYAGENYLTEIWAWILNNNQELLSSFIKKLFDVEIANDSFNISTQKHTRTESTQGYIDLIVTTSEYCFIFEHKIYHSFGEDQILKYYEWAKLEGFKPEKIMSATISAYVIDHKETIDNSKITIVNVLWHEVYKFISETISEKYTDTEKFPLKCFQNLLIKNDLTWIESEVSMDGLKNYYTALDVNQSLRDIFSHIKDKYNWKSVYEQFHRIDNKTLPPKTPLERWGRIGIDLGSDKDWSPSIFLGVLADPKDHKVSTSNPALGPDLCLIIDIDKNRFENYDKKPEYQTLKNEMKSWAQSNKNGWNFYDHLEEEVGKKNFWHPLYFRKPLFTVLESTTTPESQRSKIEDEIGLLLNVMFKETSFLSMKKKFENHD